MNRLDRILAGALWALGVLMTAVFVHLLAIFYAPKFVAADPMTRLSPLLKPNEMTVLSRDAGRGGWAPFSDPAVVQGACLFDLTKLPVRVSGEVASDRMLTLSFRTASGTIFYSMTDRAAQHGRIDVLILTNEQLEALEAESDDEEPAQELRLVAPTLEGFVLVSALAAFPNERPEAERRVGLIGCSPERPED